MRYFSCISGILLGILCFFCLCSLAFADDPFGDIELVADEILNPFEQPKKLQHMMDTDIGDKTPLPDGNIVNDIIPTIIKVLLSLFSVLLTGVALWAGALFVGSFGSEDNLSQAKKLLTWSVVGVIVTGVSYAFVSGIVSLDFNAP